MEKLALASAINPNPSFAGAPSNFVQRRSSFFLPSSQRERLASVRSKRFFVLAAKSSRIGTVPSRKISSNAFEKLKFQGLGSISSSTGQMSTATGTTPPVPPPPSYIGSPLFWVGIGVGLSALFSVAVTKIKQYALQQAFKTMMNQAPQSQTPGPPYTNSPFPFPFPPSSGAPTPGPASFYPPPPVQKQPEPKVTVDVKPTSRSDDVIIKKTEDSKKFSFVDVSPEKKEAEIPPPPKEVYESVEPEVMGSTNGTAYKSTQSESSQQSQSQASGGPTFMSVDQLEKMMEDPTVQKMVYPYLPEEMRNPTTFKWMLQNPQYRQQLQDMLNNMGGGQEWDNKMMDSLKNFDLSSPEVKQQFDQIGMTPEDVISKIMANPDMAVAFQNPRVQAAIMDCSQNPLNLAKYQNDKEVMDIFAKIAELFPGISG